MIHIDIPGWGNIEIENVVLDLNGTLAKDGRIPAEARERVQALSQKVNLYVVTADTQGSAPEETKDLNVVLVKVTEEESTKGKWEFLKTLDLEKTVVMGNGSNDQLILKEAGLGIAVLGEEGLSVSAIKNADIMVKDIGSGLDLLLKPGRLISTLRE